MKTKKILIRGACAAIASLCFATAGFSSETSQRSGKTETNKTDTNAAQATSNSMPGVSALADHPNAEHCSNLLGRKVLDSDGNDIGHLKDLVLDRGSGAIRFGLIASGGFMGVDDTVRAVPASLLRRSAATNDLHINVDNAKWKQAPVVADVQLNALDWNSRGKAIYSYFGQEGKSFSSQQSSEGLVYAKDLKGEKIWSNGKEVGKIEDLIVNLDRGIASIILDPDDEFTGTDAKYVVSFDKVTTSQANKNSFSTSLTRADFQAARPFTDYTWEEPTYISIYTWTYPVSATPVVNHNDQNAPIAAVRDAIKGDSSLSSASKDVKVSTQNGEIVLRGNVKSSDLKEKIEDKAENAAKGWKIDNQLKVASAD